jgi:hypothetical protein
MFFPPWFSNFLVAIFNKKLHPPRDLRQSRRPGARPPASNPWPSINENRETAMMDNDISFLAFSSMGAPGAVPGDPDRYKELHPFLFIY